MASRLTEAQQLSLVDPIRWQPRCVTHQDCRFQALRLVAAQDRRDYVRRKPSQAQKRVDIGRRQSLLARDVVNSEFLIPLEPQVKLACANDDPQEAWIRLRGLLGP